MAGRRSKEQAMTWLKSVAADQNSLDGINAELCLNLFEEQQRKINKLGAEFGRVLNDRNSLRESIKELKSEKQWLEENCIPDISRLTDAQKEMLKEEDVEIFEF